MMFTAIPRLQVQAQQIFSGRGWTFVPSLGTLTITENPGSRFWREEFGNYAAVTTVVIHDGVTAIGWNAFERCVNLTSVRIPDSVTSIGHYAFRDCRSLESIVLPPNIDIIQSRTFSGCRSLTSVNIPDAVKFISNDAFNDCRSLTELDIPYGVTRIEDRAFMGTTNLKSIVIPESVTFMGNEVFKDSGITSVVLPGTITSIGAAMFSGCKNLTLVNIPDSVMAIHGFAFADSGIAVIDISANVEHINATAFSGEISTPAFNVHSDNKHFSVVNGVLFNKNKTRLIRFPSGSSTAEYTIPESVVIIGDSAFMGSHNLKRVVIPDGVRGIGERAFADCSNLERVNIPESVTEIGARAFLNTALTEISFPSSITRLSDELLAGCNALESVTFSVMTPPSLAGIRVFYRSENIKAIYVPRGATAAYERVDDFLWYFQIIELDWAAPQPQLRLPTINDALNALKFIAGIDSVYHYLSETPDITEVMEILKFLAGIDSRFDIEAKPPEPPEPPVVTDPSRNFVNVKCGSTRCRTCNSDFGEDAVVVCLRGIHRQWTHISHNPLIPVRFNDAVLRTLVATGRIPENVTHLNISGNNIRNLEPLAGLTELVWLDLERNEITDVTPLAGLTKMQRLDLDFNGNLTDISALAAMTQMIELDIDRTKVSDISVVANMTLLEELDLRENPDTDLTPLIGLEHLEELLLSSSKISDFTPLLQMPQLTKLNLSGTSISGELLQQLNEMLPEGAVSMWWHNRERD
jgi:Leucine-rich repeat (LRR) protein